MSEWIEDLLSGLGDSITEGLTNVWNTISDTIWDKLLQWLYSAVFDSLADFFTKMGIMGIEVFSLPWVQAFIKLFVMFGWALFIAGIVVTVFDVAIESQSGRINVKTASLNVLKGFFAVNLFAVLPIELYKFCISLQNIFSKDLAGLFASQATGVTSIADAAKSALALLYGAPSLFNLALMIALTYCIIKIFFANIKRGGILLIQIA
ncbi:MAG: conjugal transfer protein TrbL family protein, partial [Saccharofermentanales bacterium]